MNKPRNMNEIILASGSQFRKQILEAQNIDFRCQVSNIDERKIQSGDIKHLAILRARAKSKPVCLDNPNTLVISCDQTLELDGHAFRKPKNEKEAIEHLQKLSGKLHYLHSAVVFSSSKDQKSSFILSEICVSCRMQMKKLTDTQIEQYVDTGEWRGCVGAYQAENKGADLFIREQSDLSDLTAVMGLPIRQTVIELKRLGMLKFLKQPVANT